VLAGIVATSIPVAGTDPESTLPQALSLSVAAATPPDKSSDQSSATLPERFNLAAVDPQVRAETDRETVPNSSPTQESSSAQEPSSTQETPSTTIAALDNSAEILPEPVPKDVTQTGIVTPSSESIELKIGPTEIVDECFIIDICVDRFLWELYQRAPKEDSIRELIYRKVTIKKKRKLVTVTRTSTIIIDEDFGWKDPKAAKKAGMSLADYVIGGIDRSFRLKLFQMLHAAEEAGLSPGITSGFRDDYRQSIANGLKAADNRSYHGGSLRGGYGHGLAADIVSVKGATRGERLSYSRVLWKWVDEHGSEFGIGRPYLDRDPPHMAPIDGEEYAHHRPGMKIKQAAAPPT
jgi:hypothetical protein